MNWTKEKPTDSGFYWIQWYGISIAEIADTDEHDLPHIGKIMYLIAEEAGYYLDEFNNDVSWYGPIEPPKHDEEKE